MGTKRKPGNEIEKMVEDYAFLYDPRNKAKFRRRLRKLVREAYSMGQVHESHRRDQVNLSDRELKLFIKTRFLERFGVAP